MAKLFKRGGRDQTAIEFLADADEIERRPLPLAARVTLHVLALAVVAAVVFAWRSEIDLVVATQGRLITPLPNIVLQPLETSIIQKIDVKPGQIVKKGDELATLDPTFAEADQSEIRKRLESLESQRVALEAELAGKPLVDGALSSEDHVIQSRLAEERKASYLAQMSRLDENIARIRAEQDTNHRDQAAIQSRVKVLREMYNMQERLVAERYAVRSRLLEAQDRLLEAERSAELARSRETELLKQQRSLEAERLSFQTSWRQKLMEELLAGSREQEMLKEQLQKAGKRHQLVVLTAPSDAVVLEIAKLSPGSVAKGAEALFTLVPLGDALEAEVQIESNDVGYVKRGDLVHVKLDAYPFQLHGTLEGRLQTISEDAFRRDSGSGGSAGAYYLGRIRLTKTRLDRMSSSARLLPGMTVNAEILVGKRSVISYLLWPLMKALNESIREP